MRRERHRASKGRVRPEFLSGLPTSALQQRLAQLKDDTVVLTAGYFGRTATGATSRRASRRRPGGGLGAPVYGPFNTFIGIGVVGGYMLDFRALGRQTAQDGE